MADKSASEKTEQPTPKKINDTRKKGQVATSQEVLSFFSILILVTATAFSAPHLMRWFTSIVTEGLSGQISIFNNKASFMYFINGKIVDVCFAILPILAALSVGAVVGNIIMGGLNFAPEAVSLKFDSLNPANGFGKLFNGRSIVKLLMAMAHFFFVSIIVWYYLKDKLEVLASLRWTWSSEMLTVMAKLIFGLSIRICLALLVVCAADGIYQKWKYIHDLKMTKQEVKEERKQTEGLPEVKSRIRRIRIEMATKRMLQDVPKANVVLVNPTHVAVALRYDAKKMDAPVVVAKGADNISDKIKETARAYGVPIIRKPELARTLFSTVEIGQTIPDYLYVAVAEVLAMIHRLRHMRR